MLTEYREFLRLRDALLARSWDAPWPQLEHFNWALDHFDAIDPSRVALRVVDDSGRDVQCTFGQLQENSNRVANFLRSLGLRRGDRLILMVNADVPLWETMLGAMKLGVVTIPCSTLLTQEDLADRAQRGRAAAIVAQADLAAAMSSEGSDLVEIKIAVGGPCPPGWESFGGAYLSDSSFTPDAPTNADDPLLLYFTSGTTAQPKIVVHTHVSYPMGHLSTMSWIGVRPGDVHLNLSSPGWAKHAWSSFFAPWNAEATIVSYVYDRFSASSLLQVLDSCEVSTFCAPPTVWRMLIQQDLASRRLPLRELVSAGEPLNPEVIVQVRNAWGITIRDGYGQTETTAQVGNLPGCSVKEGSMGRPLPGYSVTLLDPDGRESEEGEICLSLTRRPVGLMRGYLDDDARTSEAMREGFYHTGDLAGRDADGAITYIGRADDVFKASDYRISPFELESVLMEHEAVAEVAVVPSPDALRLSVPKAYVVLAPGHAADSRTAHAILEFCRLRTAPYKRIRRIEFSELPKTVSGKIRRVDLRAAEMRRGIDVRRPNEYWEGDVTGDPV